jgi:hypothetical protein
MDGQLATMRPGERGRRWRGRDHFDELPELVELTGMDGRHRRYPVIPARHGARVSWIEPVGFELAQSDDIFDEFGPGAVRSDY